MEYLILGGIIGGMAFSMWACVHFGTKYLEKIFFVPPPVDPSKPIVRRDRPL